MKKKIIAMLLAGGQGSRLGVLTSRVAKPAVPYGGKYRIIDFPLSNCVNSGIDTVGVLTQYRPLALNSYLGTGQHWDLDRMNGGVYVLPPYMTADEGRWYSGTANAIWQNREFIDQYDPEYVLILSGDHIYKMDYADMLRCHEAKGATATIAVMPVPWEEASRFGIMSTNDEGRITKFAEKPKQPESNLASMGIYIFNWKALRAAMEADDAQETDHDFGKNIIPALLNADEPMYAYSFKEYWKDVGTIASLWEANMDLLETPPKIQLKDPYWKIYTRNENRPPVYAGVDASINNSLVTEGSVVYGEVDHSVIFSGVHIGHGTVVRDSVIFPGARIGDNTVVEKAIIGEGATVGNNAVVGGAVREGEVVDNKLTGDITLIGNEISVADGTYLPKGTVVKTSAGEGE